MKRFSLLLVVAVAALLCSQAAFATTVQKLSLQDLTKRSESIVMARVTDAVSAWDAGHKEIYTTYTLQILNAVKGRKGESTVTIRQIGGTVDNIASIVPGMPSFKRGEQVVVFLTQKDAAGYPWVMGLQQGKYTVVEKDGAKFVRNDLADTELMLNGKKVQSVTAPDQPLGAFLDGIKTQLNTDGKIQVDPNPPTE
ncbi:MAG TPA: hypothetical protein VE402_09015 [Candidatus Angelobacter sp.]|nr:hypothetical protein [Candidatus Angelobacter sp.]